MTSTRTRTRTRLGRRLLEAVLGQRHLEQRGRHGPHRLSVVGVGRHPQPASHRPRERGQPVAVAGLQPAGRRHHRPGGPAGHDGGLRRAARSAHPGGRGRGARRPGQPSRGRRPGLRDRHPARALPRAAGRDAAAGDGRGPAGQLRADAHALAGRRLAAGAGQRTHVGRGVGGQHLHRPGRRRLPALDHVRPAVLRRRRLLCGGRRPRLPDRRPVPRAPDRGGAAPALAGAAHGKACAGCGVTSCCGPWPSSWASSTPSA